MKLRSPVTLILGAALVILGVSSLLRGGSMFSVIPLSVGASLVYLGWRGGRVAVLIFGHTCIVLGCFMITWGLYLLPYAKPDLAHVFGQPLFWGLFSVLGGICANYHGFCKCIRPWPAR